MNLRFRVLSQPRNVLPSAYSCAAAGVVVDKADIGLSIYVNGVLFFTDTVGTLTDLTTHSGTIGGVDAEFSIEDTDYFKLNLDLALLSDKADVLINVSAPEGWRNYSNEFEVYGYDIGNNPNIAYPPDPPFPGNPEFEIILAPFSFVPGGPDPVTTNIYPCAQFAVYRRPSTYEVQLVKLTSAPGEYYAFNITGNLLGTGSSILITDAQANLTAINYIGTIANMFSNPQHAADFVPSDDENEISDLDAPVPIGVDDFPTLSYTILTPGICDEDCDCIQDISAIQVTFSSTDLDPFIKDDGYVYGSFTIFDVNFTLTDSLTDEVVDTASETIAYDPDDPGYSISETYEIPDSIPFDRTYILKIEILNGVNILKSVEYPLTPCSLIELARTTCGDFVFTNKSTDCTLEIFSIDAEGVQTSVVVYDIEEGDTKEFVLADGVYVFTVTRDDVVDYNYQIFVYCKIATCMSQYINQIGCPDPCETVDCGCTDGDTPVVKGIPDVLYDMAAFTLMALTYLQEVNAIYATNWIFTVLPDNELAHLKDLVILHDRLTKYCQGCG